jgi:hypothetical protein
LLRKKERNFLFVRTTDRQCRRWLPRVPGDKSHLFCGFFLNLSLFGTGVVYTLTSATSMRYVQYDPLYMHVDFSSLLLACNLPVASHEYRLS